MGALSRFVFRISVDQTRFERRGFRGGDARARQRIESIGAAFLAGYHGALADAGAARLERTLEAVERERSGFAYEGAAMACALLDGLTPWRRDRWASLLAGPGEPHAYMLHVGAGWAHARIGGSLERLARDRDPLLQWLVLDGWGFHDGYFHWPRSVARREVPARLQGYARRAYDQGLGRSLWFVEGAEAERIATSVAGFPPGRHADLWSGVGLASAYAGEASETTLATLLGHAGDHAAALAQGAAFAAQARERAGNPAPHTERACRMLCGESAARAAESTTEALHDLPADGATPAYEAWRLRVQRRFAREPAAA